MLEKRQLAVAEQKTEKCKNEHETMDDVLSPSWWLTGYQQVLSPCWPQLTSSMGCIQWHSAAAIWVTETGDYKEDIISQDKPRHTSHVEQL